MERTAVESEEKPLEKIEGDVVIILNDGVKELIYAQGAMRVLRKCYPKNKLILITSKELEPLAKAYDLFDEIVIDPMYKWWEVHKWWDYRKQAIQRKVGIYIDLQNNNRSIWYFKLSGREKQNWSCAVYWCSHPYALKETDFHILDRHVSQLESLGIYVDRQAISPDLSYIKEDVDDYTPEEAYILFDPSPIKHKENIGWSLNNAADFIEMVENELEMKVIIVGSDAKYAKRVEDRCYGADPINLVGKLSHAGIMSLARGADFAFGHEHDSMYLAAYGDCPTIFFCPLETYIAMWAPDRKYIRMIQHENIEEISINFVFDMVNDLLLIEDEVYVYNPEEEQAKEED